MNESIINATSKSLLFVNDIATTIVVGIIIFLVGLIIARIASKLAYKVLRDFSLDGRMKKKTGIKTSFEKFISSTVFIIITLIFLVIALNYIGITNLLINILSIIIILVVIISVLLSIKDNIPNIIAYRAMRQKNIINEGDIITMDYATGTIDDISLFQVKIINEEDVIYIPNSLFLTKEFKKKNTSTKHTQKKVVKKGKVKNTPYERNSKN